MPPQNMPLGEKGYFELKATEKQQIQKSLPVYRICLNQGIHFPCEVFPLLSPLPGEEKNITEDGSLH